MTALPIWDDARSYEGDFLVLYARPELDSAHGRLRVGNRLFAADISHPPRSQSLRLSVCLVVGVAENRENIQPLLSRANAPRDHSYARLDLEGCCIRAETYIPRAGRVLNAWTIVSRADLSEFVSLLHDENLLHAVELSKGLLLGTPADLFDGEDE